MKLRCVHPQCDAFFQDTAAHLAFTRIAARAEGWTYQAQLNTKTGAMRGRDMCPKHAKQEG